MTVRVIKMKLSERHRVPQVLTTVYPENTMGESSEDEAHAA